MCIYVFLTAVVKTLCESGVTQFIWCVLPLSLNIFIAVTLAIQSVPDLVVLSFFLSYTL
jgi:hypothetical protein